ncbi:hypothetical protein GALMADRAFT_147255 [Galerina marginata CBS 339.88]|uniref:Uncharacterized protein n=1 Tax=Galerina marginata (strain CBS 339.88) TaxID=685588 RepID=A0A067SHN5_GALM3|nr:hypothetical protein GALMADRAFT_147255 [Galerina marginata CBS 339.88]
MSSVQIDIDDASNALVYAGSWSAISHQGARGSSLHQTTSAGSTLTLSYTGSPSIIIFGSIEPCAHNLAAPTYQITMDGKDGEIMTVVCNDQFQNGLSVTAEADGPSGVNANHVVTLTNLGGSQNAPLMFDYIEYTSFAGQSSGNGVQVFPPSTAAGSATASPTPTSSNPPVGVSSIIITGSKDSTAHTVGSEAVNVTITQLTTINGVATAIAVVTTSANAVTGSSSSGTSLTGGVGESRTHLIGPIVGAVLGTLLLGILLLLLRLFLLRRRLSGRLTSKPAEFVEPFHLAQNSSPERTSLSANRPSTSTAQPSSTSLQRAGFEDDKGRSRSPSQSRVRADQITGSVSDLLSPSPSPSNQQSGPTQPPSLALSYASPAYAWTSSSSRPQYRSGLSTFETSLDVPPSYDSVQNAGSKPPLDPRDLITDTD